MDAQAIIFAARQSGLAIPDPVKDYALAADLVMPMAWPDWRIGTVMDDDPNLTQKVNFLTLTGWHPVVLPHDDAEACTGWLNKVASWGLAHFA